MENTGLEKSSGIKVQGHLESYLGIVLFLAWFFTTYFSCILVTELCVIRSSERYWGIALFTSGVTALLLYFYLKSNPKNAIKPWLTLLGAGLASIGSAFIYVAFLFNPPYIPLATIGAVFTGAGMVPMITAWMHVLRNHPGEKIEVIVPASFVLAIALYFILVYLKNPASAFIVILLPLLSSLILNRRTNFPQHVAELSFKGVQSLSTERVQKVAHVAIVLAVLWLNFAFFRTFTAPDYQTNRLTHYLAPFVTGLVISLLMFIWMYFYAHQVNFVLAFRLVLPIIALSYTFVQLLTGFKQELAFTLNFAASIIVLMYMLILPVKQSKREGGCVAEYFLPYVAAMGFGVGGGVLLGIVVVMNFSTETALRLSPFILVAVITAMVVFGFNSKVMPYQANDQQIADTDDTLDEQELYTHAEDVSAQDRADLLADAYNLTSREHEVLYLLLLGRDRPYIRDDLGISVNTVGTHIRHIYNKLDINDRQQLINLAESSAKKYVDSLSDSSEEQ